MKTQVLPADSPQALSLAVETLRGGGAVAFPTDTIYGVGALAFESGAIAALFAAKSRPPEKAIPVLIAEPEDLEKVALAVPDMAHKLAARFWPGPLTLVVPKRPNLPAALSTKPTVGVRVPDHPVARALLRLSGPLAVTSANLSGQASPCTAEEVLAQLGSRIALILDGGRTPGGRPSTVVDCTAAEPLILRQGPITRQAILAALSDTP